MAYAVGHNPNNADDTPDFDDWGWDDYWTLEDWILWHKALVKKFGKTDKYGSVPADSLWLKEWAKQSFGANPKNSVEVPSKHKESIDYMLKDAPRIFLGSGAAVATAIPNQFETAIQGAQAGADAIEGTLKAAKRTFNVLKWAVPILALTAVTLIGIGVYKSATFKKF